MTLAEAYRELANLIEHVEADGLEILDAELLEKPGDTNIAELVVEFPAEDDPVELDLEEPEPEPEPEPELGEEDEDEAEQEDEPEVVACDVEGCDYEGNGRGLAIHKGRSHADGDQQDPDDDVDDEPDDSSEIWCGLCGSGPFLNRTALSGHHTGAGHEGDMQPLTERPDETSASTATEWEGAADLPDDVDEEVDDTDEPEQETEASAGAADGPAGEDDQDLERDYDDELVVDDLDDVTDVRHRSLRQQVRSAGDDVDDQELAVQIGATEAVVRELRRQVADIETRTDGGEVETVTTSTTTQLQCQNCGSHVTKEYMRVYTPEDEPAPRVCPACPDKIRDHNGTVRDARSSRNAARRVDR